MNDLSLEAKWILGIVVGVWYLGLWIILRWTDWIVERHPEPGSKEGRLDLACQRTGIWMFSPLIVFVVLVGCLVLGFAWVLFGKSKRDSNA